MLPPKAAGGGSKVREGMRGRGGATEERVEGWGRSQSANIMICDIIQ